jgi:hypothetical protein
MPALRDQWANDRVANSPYIKKDVDRAIEILLEEGFQRSDAKLGDETLERTLDNGVKETVILYRGYANGTMLFIRDGYEESRTMMAWEYNRKMRPNALERRIDSVKRKLGFG